MQTDKDMQRVAGLNEVNMGLIKDITVKMDEIKRLG